MLCFLLFLAGLGSAGGYAYFVMTPFFNGAEVRYYSAEDSWDVVQQLAANGVNQADSALLRGYAIGSDHYRAFRAWEALPQLIDMWTTPKVSQAPLNSIIWVAVADKSGKVVATYPPGIARSFGRVQQPTDEGWRGAAGPGLATNVGLQVTEIYKDSNTSIGSLTAAYTRIGWVAVIPQGLGTSQESLVDLLLFSACSFLLCAIFLPIWVAMDADWRGMRGGAWAVLVVITGVIGFAAYLIARLAPPKQCPNCHEMVQSGYKRCPACGVSLLAKCPKCGRKMGPGWQYCPRCAGERQEEDAPSVPPEQPRKPQEREVVEPVSVRLEPDAGDALPVVSHFVLGVNVADAGTGAPIGGAIVVIDGVSRVEGRTGEKGYFEARTLLAGAYTVSASARNYEPAETRVEIGAEERGSVRLALNPQPGAISGRVLDRASAQPIPGARVFIDSTRLERAATTDREGVFVLGDIPPGPYTVCAEMEGYARQTRLAEVVPGEHATIGFALESIKQEENANADQ